MIECFQCGECCKTLKEVKITRDELDILCSHGDPVVHVSGNKVLMDLPCVFLIDNKCSVWADRPCMCRMWHCGKVDPDDDILEWMGDVRALMANNPEYHAYKVKQENEAVEWGNAHGWDWRKP